jgi:FKBP-type peptidyl-prolyl cis-trans isomerase SlpA
MTERIGAGKRVTLHFSVLLAEGNVVLDSTRERPEPVSFVVGDGSLIPGFEQAINGLKAGDRRSMIIPASKGFGDWNPENLQTFARNYFDAGMALEPGLVVSFADKSKAELPGVVKEVNNDTVLVDFNHPLAGRELVFEVDIIRVTDADASPVTLAMPAR